MAGFGAFVSPSSTIAPALLQIPAHADVGALESRRQVLFLLRRALEVIRFLPAQDFELPHAESNRRLGVPNYGAVRQSESGALHLPAEMRRDRILETQSERGQDH